MNWEAIGAIAESLGALGVIITLAYLAIQLRQNSNSLNVGVLHFDSLANIRAASSDADRFL